MRRIGTALGVGEDAVQLARVSDRNRQVPSHPNEHRIPVHEAVTHSSPWYMSSLKANSAQDRRPADHQRTAAASRAHDSPMTSRYLRPGSRTAGRFQFPISSPAAHSQRV